MDEEQFFIETLRQCSDIPKKGICPWPKGRYTLTNYYVRLKTLSLI